MKNNFFLIILSIFFLIYSKSSVSNEFDIKSKQINILDNGNLVEAIGDVEVKTSDGLIIKGDISELNKELNTLTVNGNVKIINKEKNLLIESETIIYDKNKELAFSEGTTRASLKDGNYLISKNLYFDRSKMIIYSNEKTTLEQTKGNYFEFEKFNLDVETNIVNANNLLLTDQNQNKFVLKQAKINIDKKEVVGDDAKLFFEKSFFGNKENDPRLFGKKLTNNERQTKVKSGSFTTCKLHNKDKCPPWILKADEINHDKQKKIIEYKNAWLSLYDMPVLYFPYFHHPDPTVKRQSGFLIPKFNNSSNLGSSIQIPYYNVLSGNKDLTVSPRVFLNDKFIFQSEYRQANLNSNAIFDQSFLMTKNETTSHFFSNFRKNIDKDFLEINVETVSQKNYLKKYDINSPLIDNKSSLNSYLSYEKNSGESYFFTSLEVFEDLTKPNNDSFEYIYPNYIYNKDFYTNDKSIEFYSRGYQKKYETNKYDGLIVNDLNLISSLNYTNNNLLNQYSINFKNVNSKGDNSDNFRDGSDNKLLAQYIFNTSLPLIKKQENFNSYFTPKLSFRFSPTDTRNLKKDDLRIDYANLFSTNRISSDDTLEGGESLTLGTEFSLRDKSEIEKINFAVGQVFRINENDDLPEVSSIGNKRSDVIGKFKFFPNDLVNLNYSFSADKNVENLNYNFLETNFSYNNFLTSFKYLKSENVIQDKSYISNTTKFNFNKKNSLSFSTNKNLEKDLTEYYDLIYQYENDCLVAAVEYKKNYYNDADITPDENVFFSIKIVPFGKINTSSKN